MKRFFNWLMSPFARKPKVILPTVGPVTEHPGYCTCVVRPVTHLSPPFFIHFLTTGNFHKMEGVAHRVGVELAESLSQLVLCENPLQFNFSSRQNALENWREQPTIAEIRRIVSSMDIFTRDDHYLALSSYGSPALMFRAVLLDDVLMTVCFSQSGLLSEAAPVEWLQDDPIRGFTVPKMMLSTESEPRLSFVQKNSLGKRIALMLDPSLGYELNKVQSIAAELLYIVCSIHKDFDYPIRTYHLEEYLDDAAHIYSQARNKFSLTVIPGYYYDAHHGVFAIPIQVNGHPPMLLVFMPTKPPVLNRLELHDLPPVTELMSAIKNSVNRPYPITNALIAANIPSQEPMLSFNVFHEKQARACLGPVAEIVYEKTMESLKKDGACPLNALGREFSLHDVYGIFGLTSCPTEFARAVAQECDFKQRSTITMYANRHVEGFRSMFGENYGPENIDTYVACTQPMGGAVEAKLRAMLHNLRVDQRTVERERPSTVYHHRTTSLERPQFRNDWRNDVTQPDPVMQAVVVSTILQDDCPPSRHETPVSSSVCRDDSPSYDSGSSNSYNSD